MEYYQGKGNWLLPGACVEQFDSLVKAIQDLYGLKGFPESVIFCKDYKSPSAFILPENWASFTRANRLITYSYVDVVCCRGCVHCTSKDIEGSKNIEEKNDGEEEELQSSWRLLISEHYDHTAGMSIFPKHDDEVWIHAKRIFATAYKQMKAEAEVSEPLADQVTDHPAE